MDAYLSHLTDLIDGYGDNGPLSIPDGNPCPQTTSDSLAVLNGVIGLIADSIQTFHDITEVNTSPKGETTALEYTRRKVQSFKPTIQLLYRCLRRVEAGRPDYPSRCLLVNLEILIASLTESILTMSEIGTFLDDISAEAASLGIANPGLLCPRYGEFIKRLGSRLHQAEALLSTICNVLRM